MLPEAAENLMFWWFQMPIGNAIRMCNTVHESCIYDRAKECTESTLVV